MSKRFLVAIPIVGNLEISGVLEIPITYFELCIVIEADNMVEAIKRYNDKYLSTNAVCVAQLVTGNVTIFDDRVSFKDVKLLVPDFMIIAKDW